MLRNRSWKHIRKTRMPSKVISFTWTTPKGTRLTQEQEHYILVNICCRHNSESINRRFLYCLLLTYGTFILFFDYLGLLLRQSGKLVIAGSFWRVDNAVRRIWEMIPTRLFWCIWTERNRRCFDGVSTPACSLED